MKHLSNILVNFKELFALGAFAAIGVCAIFLPLPNFTGSLSGFELEDNWHFIQLKKTDSLFGNKSKIYLHLVPENDDRRQTFEAVKLLSKRITDTYPDVSAVSPVSFYSKMKLHWKKRDNSLNSFFSEAKSVPILNQLIAKDQSSFLMVVSLNDKENFDIDAFNEIIQSPLDGISSIMAISPMHIEDSIEQFIKHDIKTILILILAFFFIYIILVFRNLLAVVFTFIIVVISILASIFLFTLLGVEINLISILAIPIVLILSLSDALHLLAGFVKYKYISQKGERIKKVIAHFAFPSFFSSATTAAAFYSFFLFNEAPYIKEFGLVTAIALMVEVILTLTIAPFLLYKFNITRFYDQRLNWLSGFLIHVRKPVSLGLLALLVISVFMVNKLQFGSSSNIFFPSTSKISEVHEELKANFTSTLTLDVFVQQNFDIQEDQYFLKNTPNTLREYTKLLSEKFKEYDLVVNVNSATNNYMFITRLGMPVNLYSVLGNNNPYYDKNSDTYLITLKFSSADDIVAFQKSNLDLIIADAPEGIKVTYSSLAILMEEVNKSVATSLIKSLSTSGIVIFLMIFILTNSIKTSLFSLAPNVVPIAFVIIIFYVFNIQLNIITAITGVICLGLLDDDTVHILYRKLWLKEPMEELSFSILSSAILLIVGFGFFLVSSFEPIRVLGWVSALIFFIGVISEMTLMQWVLENVKQKKSNEI